MPRAEKIKPASKAAAKPTASSKYADDPTIYFYSPKNPHGQFSQWWMSRFTDTWIDPSSSSSTSSSTSSSSSSPSPPITYTYTSCEQYMMHRKSLLFAGPSSPITQEIIKTTDPKTLKALGRMVPNFVQKVWENEREGIVERGNYCKFSQDEKLKRYLLGTGTVELVEAAGRDKIWGVGFGVERARFERARWGLNLLGKALMRVRERIRKEEREGEGKRKIENNVEEGVVEGET